jgi:[ribosomal protein S5]-alanine N-acetyltransferase
VKLLPRFCTERLLFRFLQDADLGVIHRQFSDPDMCRFLSEPPVDRDEASAIIRMFQHPERDGYLRYGMFHRQTGEFVGTCGYHHWDRDRQQVELGYDIWKDFWRMGYATEALPPLIDICYQKLGVRCVYVLVDRDNVASRSTAAKFGFEVSEPCRHLDDSNQVCMKMDRSWWDANRSRFGCSARDGVLNDGI